MIFIFQKYFLLIIFLIVSSELIAQNFSISGRVIGEDEEPPLDDRGLKDTGDEET